MSTKPSVSASGLLLLLSAGCSSPSEAPAPDAAADGPLCLGCIDAADIDATIGRRVFSRLDGCTGDGCHGGGGGAGLLFPLGNEAQYLRNVPSTEVPTMVRVKPGDPSKSYLCLKLIGDGGIEGSRMPPGAPYDPKLVQLFQDWVESGAPDP